MNINKRKAAYLTVAAVVVIALILLALPPLIKHIAISKINEATGRKSSIRELTFNPFTLKAGVSGFKLTEKGSSAPFLSFSSARLSLSPLSLPKRSFIVTEIKIASPYLHLVRSAPNSYNFSDLVAPKKEQKKEGTPLFSLNNIVIENGSVDFEDKALKEERFHRIRGMNIAIPFISNIAYLADRYVTPHFGAVINDSPVRFDGRLKPLTRAIEATVALNLKHVDLPFYLGYVPFPLPVKLTSGHLTTGVELGYRIDAKKGPDARMSGEVALEGVELREPKGAPVASLERGKVNMGDISFLSRRGDVKSVELSGMELHVARDRAGKWNLMKLGRNANERQVKPEEKPPAGQKEDKPFDLKIETLALRGGKIHFSDSVPAGGFKTELEEINLSATALSLAQGTKSPFELKFRTSKEETLDARGNLSLRPLDLQANLALGGVSLKEYYPYLQETLAAPVQGKVGLSAEVIYNDSQGVVLRKSNLKAEGLSARFGGDEGFALQQLLVSGLTLDLKRNTADVERVDLRKGNVTISGEKGGGLSARHLLKTKLEKTAAPARPSAPARKKPALSYRIHKLTTSDIAVNFTDRTREEEPRFPLTGIALTATGITGPKQGPIPFTLSAGYGKKGRIKAGGRFTPEPVAFKGNVDLRGIPLRDFDAYLPEDLAVFIADGALDTAMAVDVAKGAGLKGSFDGSLGVRSFYCQDTDEGEDLLKWERLQLDRVKGTLAPFTLAINDVALTNFYSRVIVEKDGTLNLQHLRTSEEPGGQHGEAAATQPAAAKTSAAPPAAVKAPAAGSGTVQSAAAPPEPSSQPHPITINAITLQGGTMDFSDRHLQTPFDTTFYNLGGRVSGLSSQATRFADVDLRGNLENHSPLSIKGAINPLRGDLYLDLNVAFNDIELSPLTPYSGTYLGYNVDKGKLFLNLSYKIDKKTLSSQNKVFIDQFTFGDAVDSPKATKLPVRLAVALLKDRKGEIHLDLPVAGRTDDPQFSVWKVVLQILKNLLVKAATSPMALLGSMFGGGEDFTTVAFAPGSGRIEKGEQEKLMKLSQALQERPALTLDLTGYVERERDAEGYRNEILMRKMKGEKFRKLVKSGKTVEGQTQQEVQILPEEYPLYLKEVYVKEKFPKPRNAVGFLKSLPDEEMKKLIVTHTEVGQNELQALARERAEAVKAFLMKEGKIPAERLYLKSGDIYRPPAKEGASASRVEFAVNIR